MKSSIILFSAFILFFLLGASHQTTFSQQKNGDEITVTGEVVDANCYMQDGMDATGSGHKDCAVTCAKSGSPLAILTKDGTLYYPIAGMGKNPNDQLMDYIADQVTVKGKYYSQGNSSMGIKITTVKKAE